MININQLMQMYSQFQSNPLAFLGRRYNIPQGMNNPQDIVQHLLNSGQISQSQLNDAMRTRNSLFR